jgi:hypothetical protein
VSTNSPKSSSGAKAEKKLNRRRLIQLGAAGFVSATTLGALEKIAWQPVRLAEAATTLPDIQFDIANFLPAAISLNDGAGTIVVNFGPIYTVFLTIQLTRKPTATDSQTWQNALNTIESSYQFHPANGVFTFVSYGLPYFNRLPASVVSGHMPRLLSDNSRFALEEAVPSPTDVSPLNPGITKQTFNVPVKIETNDILVTIRSDHLDYINDVIAWLKGSNVLKSVSTRSPAFNGLFNITSQRLQFTQRGMPRAVADSHNLPYNARMNPNSSMFMGFVDQQTNGAGPASIVTFQGNSSAKFTTAKAGDYFFNGSIQHLSHDIQDLAQFYADDEPFTERCQYMFRSNPIPSVGATDQFSTGGGPAFIPNTFQGTGDAAANAQAINTFNGEHRMGHLAALQRSSRASDGTPIHIRMDGPGFDNMDVPDGSSQPKLQFTVFVPTADFFATMRVNTAALDLVEQFGVADEDNGLERFLTATRRQNFLVPPRSHRVFPLLELS